MDLELDAISRCRSRSNPGAFSLDYLLDRVKEDLNQRIGDVKWHGGEIGVVDFRADVVSPPGADSLHFFSAYDYFDDLRTWPVIDDTPLDGMVINLLPSWLRFDQMLQYFSGSLRSGSLFAFSSFGPDTLVEVARAWQQADDLPHVHSFVDMHHLGDLMLKAGLKTPIVDTEWITIDYPDYATLTKDLRYSGFANVHAARRRTLTGKNRHQTFLNALQTQNGHAESLSITFEIIYGLGFKQASGLSAPGQVLVDPPV